MKAWLPVLLPALCAGCTIEAGRGFASLEPGELRATFEPGQGRDLGDGVVLTDEGYRVRVQSLTVHARELSLFAIEAAVDEPCDSDHCHDEDGSQVDDEDVQGFVVRMPIERELDVLAGARIELDVFEPSAELGLAVIDRAELAVERLAVSATVEGPGLAEPLELTAQLASPEALPAPLAVTIDRDTPEQLAPHAWLRFDATLFDGIEFGALETDEAGSIAAENLAGATLTVELEAGGHSHDEH